MNRVSRLNDRSLELLILLARGYSVLAAAAFMAFGLVAIWTTGHTQASALISQAVSLGNALGIGYWAWWQRGNVEWAPVLYDGARWGELHCNIQVGKDGRHDGPHGDGLRDPEGAQTWS